MLAFLEDNIFSIYNKQNKLLLTTKLLFLVTSSSSVSTVYNEVIANIHCQIYFEILRTDIYNSVKKIWITFMLEFMSLHFC